MVDALRWIADAGGAWAPFASRIAQSVETISGAAAKLLSVWGKPRRKPEATEVKL